MIIVAAHVTVKDGMGSEFVKVAQDCIANTRKEPGNISYILLTNTENPNKLTFFEEWKSQADLDAHMKTTHFLAFNKANAELLAQPSVLAIYSAEPVKA